MNKTARLSREGGNLLTLVHVMISDAILTEKIYLLSVKNDLEQVPGRCRA